MNKIRMLTFHRAINNGAVLQSFALAEAFCKMNIDAKYIDYTSPKIQNDYYIAPLMSRRSLKSIAVFFLVDLNILESKRKFADFVKQYIPVETYDSPLNEKMFDDVDILLSGGDQLWNLDLTGNDLTYFFDFSKKHVKASYGTSFGKKFSQEEMHDIASHIQDYKYLYVREPDGKSLIQQLSGKECSVVPDPVFLLSKEEWISIFHLKSHERKDYVLFFELHENGEMREFAKKIAKEKGYRILRITNDFFTIKGMESIKRTGPLDFLTYILGAKLVVTDSFHAAAFSLLFNKELFIGLKTGEFAGLNSRILNLAECYGISNRIIGEDVSFAELDYSRINKKIAEQKAFGLIALRQIAKEKQ